MQLKGINGFTLIEVLLAVGIVSIISFISIPLSIHSLHKYEEKLFLSLFEYDLLYAQSLATTTTERVRIIFHQHSYQIVKGEANSEVEMRTIPEHITVNTRLRNIIAFDRNGRIQNLQQGRIEFKGKDTNYYVIFPLGKGRGYIAEQ